MSSHEEPNTWDAHSLYESTLGKCSTRDPDLVRDHIKLAYAGLYDALCQWVPQVVEEATALGKTEAVLFMWDNNETRDGIDILYLVRGPRKGSVHRRGMPEPLLKKLRQELAPFQVYHEWDSAVHRNRLLLRWNRV